MTQSHLISVTRADIAWAIVVAVLMGATFYYSGLSAGRREFARELAKSLWSLHDERVACEEALNAYREAHRRECYWFLEKSRDDEYYIYWD